MSANTVAVRDAGRPASRKVAARLGAGPGDCYLVALAGEEERPELALAVGLTRSEAIASALAYAADLGASLDGAAVLVYAIEGTKADR